MNNANQMFAVTGQTFENRLVLKQIGKWNAARKAWIVDDKGKKRVEQACFRNVRSGQIQINSIQ